MKKILSIFGTRPEAIKMAPVIKELEKDKSLKSKVCVTAQHRGMLDQVLKIFNIKPDFDLDLMKRDQNLSDLTARILMNVTKVFEDFKPDIILVHGDTTTTLASTLAAYYHKIPVGHVEAGLRTGNIFSPWPEEGNRKLTDTITKYHFAPTEISKQNLINESINKNNIHITGNTVIDALFLAKDIISSNKKILSKFNNQFSFLNKDRKLVLITGHRRESFGNGFKQICNGIAHLANKFKEVEFLYPMHLNPNVRKPVTKLLSKYENIFLIEPVDYLPFVYLMDKAHILLTDSGGIQEEAPSLGKPVLLMRETTERPEAVDAGTVKLVGTNSKKIISETTELLTSSKAYNSMSFSHNPYGDGKASKRIIEVLKES